MQKYIHVNSFNSLLAFLYIIHVISDMNYIYVNLFFYIVLYFWKAIAVNN